MICFLFAELSDRFGSFTLRTDATEHLHSMNEDFKFDCFEQTRAHCGHPESCVRPYKLQVEFAPANRNFKIVWSEYTTTAVGDFGFLDEESGVFRFFSFPSRAAGVTGSIIDGTYRCKIHPDGDMRNIKFINEKYLKFISSPGKLL